MSDINELKERKARYESLIDQYNNSLPYANDVLKNLESCKKRLSDALNNLYESFTVDKTIINYSDYLEIDRELKEKTKTLENEIIRNINSSLNTLPCNISEVDNLIADCEELIQLSEGDG